MEKKIPQIGIKNYKKNQITGKAKNMVKVADQPSMKIIWRLKVKSTKITYFNDKRVTDRDTLNKRLYMISKT